MRIQKERKGVRLILYRRLDGSKNVEQDFL